MTAGNGGRGRGSPRWPSIEVMSAVSSPQTKAPEPMRISRSKSKPRAHDVVAEQAVLARLPERVLEALDGERVLGAHVHVALVRADGEGADDHALDERVRVALEHRAVHERAGVALVRVAEDVLGVVVLLLGEAPLHPGGEAGAAAAAEAGGEDLFDDLLGRHRGEHLGEGLVAVAGDVLVDVERVDDARVAQHDLDLAVEERDVVHLRLRPVGAGRVAHEALDHAPLEQVFLDDLGHVVDLDVLVEDAVGVDQRHGALHAGAEAAGLDDVDLAGELARLEFFAHRLAHVEGAGGDAAAAGADQEVTSHVSHSRFTRSQVLMRYASTGVPPTRWLTTIVWTLSLSSRP